MQELRRPYVHLRLTELAEPLEKFNPTKNASNNGKEILNCSADINVASEILNNDTMSQ